MAPCQKRAHFSPRPDADHGLDLVCAPDALRVAPSRGRTSHGPDPWPTAPDAKCHLSGRRLDHARAAVGQGHRPPSRWQQAQQPAPGCRPVRVGPAQVHHDGHQPDERTDHDPGRVAQARSAATAPWNGAVGWPPPPRWRLPRCRDPVADSPEVLLSHQREDAVVAAEQPSGHAAR